jgi:surface carbohydrate biosynthesis protein
MSKTVSIVTPVETVVRELDCRLLLAALYAKRHHRFFIGWPTATYRALRHLDGDKIYIGKDILSPSAENPARYYEAKKTGLILVHIDEEGGAYPGGEETWKRYLFWRIEPARLGPEDYMCTWGDFQTEYYKSVGATCDVRTTGHPRFDLCRPRFRAYYEPAVADIRAKYNNFVLVNTNFTLAFNPVGPTHTFSDANGYIADDDDKRMTLVSTWARHLRTAASMVQLVHQLSIKRPDVRFVIRPHPAEDETFYLAAFRGVPNVHVVRDGSANAWTCAARAMIHSGSTSGLEGHLLERPVVYYDGGVEGDIDLYLPSVVGRRCKTQPEALETVLAILESKDTDWVTRDVPERARKLFRNFDDEASFAVLESVALAEEKARKGNGGRGDIALKLDELRAEAVENAKRVVRPIIGRGLRSARHARKAHFPGFRAEDIRERIANMHRVTGTRLEFRLHGRSLLEVWADRA